MLRDAGPRRSTPRGGQPRKHGGVLAFSKPDSWHTADQTNVCDTTRYGKAEALAWDRMHPRLTAQGPWLDHCGELPLIHGILIRLQVEHLPGDRDPKPVWLWHSPWERPAEPRRLTPARVRRGFRHLRAKTARPAGGPNPPVPAPAAHTAPKTAHGSSSNPTAAHNPHGDPATGHPASASGPEATARSAPTARRSTAHRTDGRMVQTRGPGGRGGSHSALLARFATAQTSIASSRTRERGQRVLGRATARAATDSPWESRTQAPTAAMPRPLSPKLVA